MVSPCGGSYESPYGREEEDSSRPDVIKLTISKTLRAVGRANIVELVDALSEAIIKAGYLSPEECQKCIRTEVIEQLKAEGWVKLVKDQTVEIPTYGHLHIFSYDEVSGDMLKAGFKKVEE